MAVITAAAALHAMAGPHYPVPWSDDSYDLIPARAWAERGSLRVTELGQPDGIFWLPDGYYVLIGSLFRLGLPQTLEAARWVSFGCAALVVVALPLALPRHRRPLALAATAIWMFGPRTVLMANIARFEMPVLAVVAVATLAASRGRRVLSLSLSALACLIHPAAAAFLIPMIALQPHSRERTPQWERAFAAVVGVCLLAEALHYAAHWTLALDHLTQKLEFKAANGVQLDVIAAPAALLVVAFLALRMTRRSQSGGLAPLLAGLAASAATILVMGREVMYQVYGYETAILLLTLTAVAVLPPAASAWRQTSPLLAGGALTLVAFTYGPQLADDRPLPLHPYSQYGMTIGDGPLDEWRTFTNEVEAELSRLDAAALATKRVVIETGSPMGFELTGMQFRQLVFVVQTRLRAEQGGCHAEILTRERTRGAPLPNQLAGDIVVPSEAGNFAFTMKCS